MTDAPDGHILDWERHESPFDWMGSNKSADRLIISAAEFPEISLRKAQPIGTTLAEDPPYFLGPCIRPNDAAMFVGKPGHGKSSLLADLIVGSYDILNPTALCGAWKIDNKFQHGRTYILNGETGSRDEWMMMIHKALLGRGRSPHDVIGRMICTEMVHFIDPASEGFDLYLNDHQREARVMRLADELARHGTSMLVLDPVFAIFGAAENSDNAWIFQSLVPLIKACKARNITTILVTHPPGGAESSNASLDQQFSPYGSKQQIALIDAHFGVKRDSSDHIVLYRRKSRRADWIGKTKNHGLILTKGKPGGYRGVDGEWPHQSPDGLPLPPDTITLIKLLPDTHEPWHRPDTIGAKKMTELFKAWLEPYALVTRTQLTDERGKPYVYTWTRRGLVERKKL